MNNQLPVEDYPEGEERLKLPIVGKPKRKDHEKYRSWPKLPIVLFLFIDR